VLRIETSSNGQTTTLRLSGRIESEQLPLLQVQIEGCSQKTILNLEEVGLVDRAAVRFLGLCESNGVELLNCSLYIREWILRENGRKLGRTAHVTIPAAKEPVVPWTESDHE
jgi:hypothetical protein